MSFFGFDPLGPSAHNSSAPGFAQPNDAFAGLSGQHGDDEDAIDFEDTYDGLLDDAADADNAITFGNNSVEKDGSKTVGGEKLSDAEKKQLNYSENTAKFTNDMREEHLRFNQPQPTARASVSQHQSQPAAALGQSYAQQPYVQQPYAHQSYGQSYFAEPVPIRTGYEKYRESEPLPDLHVDQSIWGIGPSKAAAAPKPAPQPALSSSVGRKMMSLEEVEAAMHAQSKPSTQPAISELAAHQHTPSYSSAQHASPLPQHSHAQPVAILQRPQASQAMVTPAPAAKLPVPPGQHDQHNNFQRQPVPQVQPMQILQNPNRLSTDVSRAAVDQEYSQLPSVVPTLAQMRDHSQTAHMSEEEMAAHLDRAAKSAKREHEERLLFRYRELMTALDKRFIARIQLHQLVSATGDPIEQGSDASLSEDFYYQVYSHIRAGQHRDPRQPLSNFAQTYLLQTGDRHGNMRRHGRPAENHIQRMEQQVQRAVEAAKNKPKNPQLVIAGSLGKISFSNAKTPKPLLNIKRNVENEAHLRRAGSERKSPASSLDRRTILRNAEKVYVTLMQIEDHVRLMPPPLTTHADQALQEKHREWKTALESLNARLWEELKVHEPIGVIVPHPFIAFLSCDKGKKAIPRIFLHLSFEQRTTIMTMIVYHLDQLDVMKGAAESDDQTVLNPTMWEKIDLFMSTVMPSLMGFFNDTGLDIVDGMLNLIATNLNVVAIAQTRVGVSLLTMIFSRAEHMKQNGDGTPEQWEKWDQTYETLFSRLEVSLPYMFPGNIDSGSDVLAWQLLATLGLCARNEYETRLVVAARDRVNATVALAKTLPPTEARERLSGVALFLRSLHLRVEDLM
ncbi:hypothetical protein ACHAPE_002183 [Trichoderma viride]